MKSKLSDHRHVGPAGTATLLEITTEPGDRPDVAATLSSFWVHCPGQTPFWDLYLLAIIHLRDIPGTKAAHIRVPGATHEVMLFAFDPDMHPSPDNPETWRFLHPHNLMEQIILPDDDAAVNLLDMAAKAVAEGLTWAEPPLSGQVEPWRTMLIKTSAHFRGEEHAP